MLHALHAILLSHENPASHGRRQTEIFMPFNGLVLTIMKRLGTSISL